MFRSSNNSSIYIVSIRRHASVVALHSGVVVEVLDIWPMVNLDEGIGERIAEQNSKHQL
jgi:hypothetical protein